MNEECNNFRERAPRILMVDDDPYLSLLLADYLEEKGAEIVDIASIVEVATSKLLENEYDILISDHLLVDSIQQEDRQYACDFIQRLRQGKISKDERIKSMPVIIVSGYLLLSSSFNKIRNLYPSNTKFIAKPYEPKEILLAIEECLEN
ncbi:response regulator [Trichocoleus desertorum AS-A10]|uniref:response regulator n=1 Tax=Trichocoleus desertorum TaxID=1481672 RepID=UPI0032996DDE